jgi:hypothetical protein
MKLLLTPLTLLITFYQKFISPAFAPRCKYYPSCSSYALTAIKTYESKVLGWQPGEYCVVTHGPTVELITLKRKANQSKKAM